MYVCRGGRRDDDASGESEIKNDADVDSNSFNACRTGV